MDLDGYKVPLSPEYLTILAFDKYDILRDIPSNKLDIVKKKLQIISSRFKDITMDEYEWNFDMYLFWLNISILILICYEFSLAKNQVFIMCHFHSQIPLTQEYLTA